jgi:hypothetical protein
MTEAKPYLPVKLICGLISGNDDAFLRAGEALTREFGPVDSASESFPFDMTRYYQEEMGQDLSRRFLSFERLVQPDSLSRIKLRTNRMESEIRELFQAGSSRIINIDPGCLNGSALVMGTAKDFSHRIPIGGGIYAHLELLFVKDGIKTLGWTYPDFRSSRYHRWLLDVRKHYLEQLRSPGS